MELVPFISMMVCALALPAAVLTAILAGLLRVFPIFEARPGLAILFTGSVLPLVMLAYGLSVSSQPAAGPVGDFVSLDWWLITAAPPSWIVCLLVAWGIIRGSAKPSKR